MVKNKIKYESVNRQAWVLVVNTENQYEPLEVTITRVYPSKWNNEHVDYGVEYELIGRVRKVRISDNKVYFTKWQAEQMAQHLNGEY